MNDPERQHQSTVKSPPVPIRAAIIEDEEDIREGIGELIDFTEGFRCNGRYRTMEEALAGLPAATPDVMLVDIGLPGISGIEGIRIIRERFPSIQLLMLTVYDDDDRIFEALCAGATGYLLKKTPTARLLESLREAFGGGSPMSPEVARKVVGLFRKVRPPERTDHDLTPHEQRVLKMFAEGHNYKTAAAELGVTINTVAFHVKQIYGKLEVHSKSEAVVKAIRSGLIEL
jgi:DNA-binding NarL/FixJ family response regulator